MLAWQRMENGLWQSRMEGDFSHITEQILGETSQAGGSGPCFSLLERGNNGTAKSERFAVQTKG